MGRIFKEVGVLGSANRYKRLKALFDTGAGDNYIGEEFDDGSLVYDLGVLEYGEEKPIILPDGSEIMGKKIKLKLLKIDGTEPITKPEFYLFDMKRCEVIMGAKLMQQLKIILNPSMKEIIFG